MAKTKKLPNEALPEVASVEESSVLVRFSQPKSEQDPRFSSVDTKLHQGFIKPSQLGKDEKLVEKGGNMFVEYFDLPSHVTYLL